MSSVVRRLLPAVAFLAVGFGVAAWTAGGGEHAPDGIDAAEAAGDAQIPARPRPDTPPETVAASGACGEAMASVRSLVTAVPSGALLDESQNRALTEGLAAVDRACAGELAAAFRDQEVVPWLTWAPPDPGGPSGG